MYLTPSVIVVTNQKINIMKSENKYHVYSILKLSVLKFTMKIVHVLETGLRKRILFLFYYNTDVLMETNYL